MSKSDVYSKIITLSKDFEKEVIQIRRDIHMHPELSFQEIRTSEIVANKLKELGMQVTCDIAKTGVVGVLEGKYPGKTIALRADMDALPLQEATGLPFSSVNDGVMHACGHDCHTANLLGVAKILSQIKDEIHGTVKFIFQPGEENGGGGREMVKEGVLENPKVDAIVAMHVWTEPLGYLGIKYGASTAYSDRITLKIKGKKAHTSTPQKGVDAIVIAGHIITSLQSIISRQLDPLEGATFSLGQINGGTAPNIVPDSVEIVGMMRCLTSETREIIKSNVEKIASAIAIGMGGECEFEFREGYPSVLNDKTMTDLVKGIAQQTYGLIKADNNFLSEQSVPFEELIHIRERAKLGAEDFGFYSHKVPACLFWIGSGESASSHSPQFIIDERVFKITLVLMASTAIRFLNQY